MWTHIVWLEGEVVEKCVVPTVWIKDILTIFKLGTVEHNLFIIYHV